MRTAEERILAIKSRAKEIETKKQILKGNTIRISSLAASLILIVGLSFLISPIMDSMPAGEYKNFGTSASIFEGNNCLGYILIGFLAFALGISITILLYKIKQKNQQDKEDKDD